MELQKLSVDQKKVLELIQFKDQFLAQIMEYVSNLKEEKFVQDIGTGSPGQMSRWKNWHPGNPLREPTGPKKTTTPQSAGSREPDKYDSRRCASESVEGRWRLQCDNPK